MKFEPHKVESDTKDSPWEEELSIHSLSLRPLAHIQRKTNFNDPKQQSSTTKKIIVEWSLSFSLSRCFSFLQKSSIDNVFTRAFRRSNFFLTTDTNSSTIVVHPCPQWMSPGKRKYSVQRKFVRFLTYSWSLAIRPSNAFYSCRLENKSRYFRLFGDSMTTDYQWHERAKIPTRTRVSFVDVANPWHTDRMNSICVYVPPIVQQIGGRQK